MTPTDKQAAVEAALDQPVANTDRELWRERPGDYYANSIHVTEQGSIGINCGGTVFVMPIREWHKLAATRIERLSASEAAGGEVVLSPEDAALVNRTVKNCTAAFDRWLDGLAERLFWEFDERHKRTGMQRDAFKAAIREAVAEHEAKLYATPPPPRDAGREWQPIETAPKDEYVLVSCGPGGMIEACQPAEFVGKQYPWIDSYGSAVVGPEYWMPLPAPPRALAGGSSS